MKSLKMDPRDALPNTVALARADALFAELSGGARAELGQVIAAFRAALESQDPAVIERLREHLNHAVAALRPLATAPPAH
jgi:molecular chaperone HscC